MIVTNKAIRLLLLAAAALTSHIVSSAAAERAAPRASAVVTSGLIHVEEGIDYAVPAAGPFQFAKLEPDFLGASFTGRVTLSGTYYYGQLADYPGDDTVGLYFMPDAGDAKRLPHWVQDSVVKEIVLQNSDAFIRAVIPAKIARAVKRGRRASAQGRVTIVAEGFEAVVSCGSSIYVTRFHSIAREPKLYAARSTVERTTC
jgi:hypothetical protein